MPARASETHPAFPLGKGNEMPEKKVLEERVGPWDGTLGGLFPWHWAESALQDQ